MRLIAELTCRWSDVEDESVKHEIFAYIAILINRLEEKYLYTIIGCSTAGL